LVLRHGIRWLVKLSTHFLHLYLPLFAVRSLGNLLDDRRHDSFPDIVQYRRQHRRSMAIA
jgi:hypothetical protein